MGSKRSKEGLEEGMEEGRVEAQRQTLLRLLEWRFHLSAAQQAEYTQRLGQVTDLHMLTQLIDHLLAAQTLAEFDDHLATCLSPANGR
jgi:hypothetical protein